MANGNNANPLAMPLQSIKQIGDSLTQSIQSMSSGLSTSLSQTLDSLVQGAPQLPGLPGSQGQKGLPGLPNVQSLMPANLTQALSNIENVIIPQGLPKPSSLMPQPAAPATQPSQTPASQTVGVVAQGSPSSPSVIQQPDGYKPANTAIQGRRRITQLGGY